MKRIFAKFTPRVTAQILRKTVPRVIIGFALSLLWDRYINTEERFLMVERAFFVVGACLFALAWFSYLRMDGLLLNIFDEKRAQKREELKAQRQKEKRPVHPLKSAADFITEPTGQEEPATQDEKAFAAMAANLLAGAVFMAPSIVAMLV